jgi:hypothetical protein
MGRWPAQGDEKRFSSNYCCWKRTGPIQQLLSLVARPSPLSSRPELRRSVVERSAVSAVFPWEVFFDRAYPDFLLRVASDVHVCGSP